ncbi:hypothetical protein GIB67_019471 [Kingdonia uniflora]|uniref:Uncharacterized protein n=1 Tax=Kingdonia uniflora TaxID=39325 RepID=A0A7J7N009_9MAGN|nr:hypothetical protein GIB67_019471 [Kingdonia uniflora]
MANTLSASTTTNLNSTHSYHHHHCHSRRFWVQTLKKSASFMTIMTKQSNRRTFVCAVNQDAEKAFLKTVEVDRLIELLRDANPNEDSSLHYKDVRVQLLAGGEVWHLCCRALERLQKLIVENVLAFNESFWIRLAARTETCKSEDDKAWFFTFLILHCIKDYEDLALSVMSIVDQVVRKTKEKIESATDVLKEILRPVVEVEETTWPPRYPEALVMMEKELIQREREGQLDEGFLSEVNAQLRQAKEDGDKPGLEAMLQKVLQLYASTILSKRSYAKKGSEILKSEEFLENIIKAPEEEWNRLLLNGLTVGKGDISPEDFYTVVKKRIERTLIRTSIHNSQEGGLDEFEGRRFLSTTGYNRISERYPIKSRGDYPSALREGTIIHTSFTQKSVPLR